MESEFSPENQTTEQTQSTQISNTRNVLSSKLKPVYLMYAIPILCLWALIDPYSAFAVFICSAIVFIIYVIISGTRLTYNRLLKRNTNPVLRILIAIIAFVLIGYGTCAGTILVSSVFVEFINFFNGTTL